VIYIGGANFYSAFRQAKSHELSSIAGADFTASKVAAAQTKKQQKGFGNNINFSEGDVRLMPVSGKIFDLVCIIRTLIYLPTRPQKMQGIAK
jgi:ubiquinone/menaquinone biosynthesis C-methylase UbiE